MVARAPKQDADFVGRPRNHVHSQMPDRFLDRVAPLVLALVAVVSVAGIVFLVLQLLKIPVPSLAPSLPHDPGARCTGKIACASPKDGDLGGSDCCFTSAECRLKRDGSYACCPQPAWDHDNETCCAAGEIFSPSRKGCTIPCGPSSLPCDASRNEKCVRVRGLSQAAIDALRNDRHFRGSEDRDAFLCEPATRCSYSGDAVTIPGRILTVLQPGFRATAPQPDGSIHYNDESHDSKGGSVQQDLLQMTSENMGSTLKGIAAKLGRNEPDALGMWCSETPDADIVIQSFAGLTTDCTWRDCMDLQSSKIRPDAKLTHRPSEHYFSALPSCFEEGRRR